MDIANIIRQVVISAVPIMIAIILHEVSHGYVANKLGDPTARMLGRLTLNPIAHIDPFGTVIMPLLLYVFTNGQFVFGYAKPVPISPVNFKNQKRDMAISAAAGPVVNILLALISLILLKYGLLPASSFMSEDMAARVAQPLALMLKSAIIINVVLASFNLIPIPPLDGGRVAMGLLPRSQSQALGRLEPYGMIIVMLLVATGIWRYIMYPVTFVIGFLLSLV
jgi:Zn-dependent protease